MTPEAQRIAIAEACGWHDCGVIDLNAMHEAEKVLTDTNRYVACLRSVTDRLTNDFVFVHATAAQRAEAFLRTLNLWKP